MILALLIPIPFRMSFVKLIPDDFVKNCLEWKTLVPVIEKSLVDISIKNKSTIQPPRLFMDIPDKQGLFLAMPSYSENEHALACKLVTSFPQNKSIGIPSVLANILLFDPITGKIKAIVEANRITAWRTAAASVVATKCLHKGDKNILAILGAGTQAESHALALKEIFDFKEVRIWNRTRERAKILSSKLPFESTIFDSNEECVKDADVICTATYAKEPILQDSWVKEGAHINAIGAGQNHHSELSEALYKKSFLVVDHMESADKELAGLIEMGIDIQGEIGNYLNSLKAVPESVSCTIFHNLGIAIEDLATANFIYNKFTKGQK